MEMMQVILNYPQVHTDMVFENIPTLPIEHRAGIERTTTNQDNVENPPDGAYTSILCYEVRLGKDMPVWRQHRSEELLILKGCFDTPISVDKIKTFTLHPPELRHMFMSVGNYYRWFHILFFILKMRY